MLHCQNCLICPQRRWSDSISSLLFAYWSVTDDYSQPYMSSGYPHQPPTLMPDHRGSDSRSANQKSSKPKRRRVTTPVQRKAANVRERKRMFSLNDAFDRLRKVSQDWSHCNQHGMIDVFHNLRIQLLTLYFQCELLQFFDWLSLSYWDIGPKLC